MAVPSICPLRGSQSSGTLRPKSAPASASMAPRRDDPLRPEVRMKVRVERPAPVPDSCIGLTQSASMIRFCRRRSRQYNAPPESEPKRWSDEEVSSRSNIQLVAENSCKRMKTLNFRDRAADRGRFRPIVSGQNQALYRPKTNCYAHTFGFLPPIMDQPGLFSAPGAALHLTICFLKN